MPTHTQLIVEVPSTSESTGTNSTETTVSCFPASPIHMGEITDDERKASFEELVLAGEINDGGHTFGTLNRDFVDAPNYGDVETGAGGLPASAWAPNPVSPGPGSLNPSDQAEAPSGFGETPNDTWGVGVGSQLDPSESSEQQSGGTLGDYVMGKAWGTST
jgi:hypothetical protein